MSLPQDPFERWAALQAQSNDPTNRLDAGIDLAFWERVADDYDAHALALRVPRVLERVRQLVPPDSRVLEIGAGTGAFTLPLAAHARSITALDYSPAMLGVLRRKLTSEPICPVLQRWEDAQPEPHDVVLAANALYRVVDLRAALDKMLRAARARGIVVWSIGRQPGHDPGYRPGPDYIHLLDGLFELNVFANVEIIEGVAVISWECAA